MARTKNKSATESVTLFPFLAVLASVIGSLLFIIAALALAQVGRAESASNRQAKMTNTRTEDLRRRRAELSDQLAAAQAEMAEAQALSNELARLLKPPPEPPPNPADELERLRADQTNVQNQVKTLQAEYLRQLRRKESPDKIAVLPGGSDNRRSPTFVECAGDGLTVHDLRGASPRRVPLTQVATSSAFSDLLHAHPASGESTIVFLIRPSGLPAFSAAALQAEKSGTRYGKLPIPGEGELDFSAFRRP